MSMLGQQAPDFSLDATTGQKVHLADLHGSFVVLIFYPANDTPVCNKQLDEASVSAAQLLQHNARVFGVNTAKVEKSRDYCTRKRLEFPILADPGGTVARKYNAFWGWIAMNRRTVVGIDPDGKIMFFERGTPSGEKIINAIQQHQSMQHTA
jgi:peroxiredoxin Q/BCP